jgi:hypothetical protein
VWNRDLRAAGVTEGRQAGAPSDDLAKQAGHANKRTTARVYDRDQLEAARRVAQARARYRGRTESEGGVLRCVAHPNGIKGLRCVFLNGPLTAAP